MTQFNLKPLVLGVALASAASGVTNTYAREAVVIEEIIVTATRRSLAMEDVPSNIAAYQSDYLDRRRIYSFQDLAQVVPGLSIPNLDPTRGGWGGNVPVLRGVNANGLSANSPNVSPASIAIYYGGASLPTMLNLADIERVEVLRGPQGTLYGSGSLSGTLKVVPKAVELGSYSARISAEGSSTNHSDDLNSAYEIVANLGFSDKLGVRLLADRRQYAGYIDEQRIIQLDGKPKAVKPPGFSVPGDPGDLSTPFTLTRHADANEQTSENYRASVKFKPSDWFTLELSHDRQQSDADTTSVENPNFNGSIGDYEATQNQLLPSERELELTRFDVEADFGFATVTVNASTYDDSYDGQANGTDLWLNFADIFYYTPYGDAFPTSFMVQGFRFSESEGDTLEVQLSSNGDGPLSWVIGAFHSDQKQVFQNQFFLPGIREYADAAGSSYPFREASGFGVIDPPGIPVDLTWQFDRSLDFEEFSSFVDVDYQITERLQVGAGVRVFDQELAVSAVSELYHCNAFCAEDGVSPFGRFPVESSSDFNDEVFRLSANYQISDNTLGYVTWAEGFRRGGANGVATAGPSAEPVALQTYEPDTVSSFEIGVKGTIAGWFYTASVFDMTWDNVQIEQILPLGSWYAVVNGEEAKSTGVELEVRGQVTDSVSLTAGYAYVDARLSEDFSIETGNPEAGFFDMTGESGEQLPGAPKHTLTASLDWYTSNLMGRDIDGLLNINMSYRDQANTELRGGSAAPVPVIDDFMIVNASFSLESGRWRAALFADNIFEERGVSATKETLYPGDALNEFAYEHVTRPRTIGLKFSYAFGESN